jgi:hypothetical protein
MFYKLIYLEYSIIPPPKVFTVPPETPCVCPGSEKTINDPEKSCVY